MKALLRTLPALFLLASFNTLHAQDKWVDSYDRLLKKYVSSGGVKYKAWHASAEDKKALSSVVSAIKAQDVSGMSKDEKIAFYLNAYNANILDKILADYPTDGPGGGGLLGRNRFFKSKNIKVAGKTTSFHALENETIRPLKEPRIHFALNCASASCPPLHDSAFKSATLDKTLDSLTKKFVSNNPLGVSKVSGGKVAVSKIFDWYGEDFPGGVLTYINSHRTEKLPSGTKVSFQDYSWKLNAAK